MTNVQPIFRKKSSEKSNNKIIPSTFAKILNKVEDFNNIVVMSGTATRKSLEKKENHSEVKPIQKNNFKDSILKLRAPSYKSHYKQTHTEEKLMTKSCEILLGCIKPYKDIRIAKKTKVTESITIGSILKTTNIIYERKATRKVRFISFDEENPTSSYSLTNQSCSMRLLATAQEETENENPQIEDVRKLKVFDETETSPNHTIKTVSSEDFITKVIPQTGVSTLI